ncbi:MAG: Gfo/Idh/MocA family oxidoreductase [Acidimicrobiales bacterium]|nr:Gfo/Idh/MocA family oxidoreductase [Acidimicrobiales bacterium]
MTIKIGFIGTGLISHMHLAFLMTSSEPNRVVAVHDVDPDRARAFASLCGASVVGVDELFDAVDLVYVTTWTSEHPSLVRAAADRGVAVYCEKPLATTVTDVEQMIADVERAGVANQVGLVLRSLPAWLLVRDLVADPAAGRLMAVSFRDDQYIPVQGRYASTWRGDPARAGRGALIEHSIHDVDILQWAFGDVTEVTGRVREFHGLDRIDDVATAQLAFGSGAVASLTSVWHDVLERPSMRFVEVFCERLAVSIDGDSDATVRWQYTGHDADERSGVALVQECRERGIAPTDDVTELLGGRVFNPATPFLHALRTGGPSPLPVREALAAHRIVDAVYRSADHGARPVEIVAG